MFLCLAHSPHRSRWFVGIHLLVQRPSSQRVLLTTQSKWKPLPSDHISCILLSLYLSALSGIILAIAVLSFSVFSTRTWALKGMDLFFLILPNVPVLKIMCAHTIHSKLYFKWIFWEQIFKNLFHWINTSFMLSIVLGEGAYIERQTLHHFITFY